MVQLVKNLPTNAGESRDVSSFPGSGRSPGEGNGNPLQCSCLENSMDQETGGPQSMGSQRVGHDWACARTHIHRLFYNIRFLVPILSSGSSWHNFHRETILTHLTKVTIKDFKGKYRTDHLESKLKICYQRQLNILRKLVLFTKRKIKFKFCASLRLKSTYSMKFFLNWANQEAAKQ